MFSGPQEIVPQSSDQVLKGKGLFRRLKVWGRGSQEEPTPRHVVPLGENLRARLDFSNESLHLAGNQAPVLSPGGDPVMSGDNLATGAEGSDRPPVRRSLAGPLSPPPLFKILRKTPGSRSRRNPRLKDFGKTDRVTRSQTRLSRGGLRVSVPEGTPKMG